MSTAAINQLITQAQQRNPDAVAALYRQYAPLITRYIGYRVADPAVLEDLTANVFLIMVEKLPTYQNRGAPFEAWLYRIASTQIADHYRRQYKHPHTDLDESQASSQPSLETMIQDQEYLHDLRTALNKLSEDDQTILFLRFVERKKHEEVAQMMGKSPQAVATAQHRALKQLARLIKIGEKGGDHVYNTPG